MTTLLDFFERTNHKEPDRIAVEDETSSLSRSELLHDSQQAGTAICRLISSRKPVVLFMEKSTRMLSLMFGTLYAGCFYVPADPSQPAERLKHIFDVLQSELVVTLPQYDELLNRTGYSGTRCYPDDLLSSPADPALLSERRSSITDSDILYVMFTSGSTGIPKGIAVSQRSVIDFIGHFTKTFGISESDVIGNQAPFDFDVSVKDIYSCLMTGAKLVLIPQKMFATPPILLDYLCDRKVTNLTWAVSALTMVSALKGLRYRKPEYVRRVMFSGEVMPIKQLKLWQEALPDALFVNLYGPTEITCNCSYYPITRVYEEQEKIPIGQAFPGRSVFLLNENDQRITEPGVPGEICVTGESLAIGYYRNERETDRRFVMHTENGVSSRCYHTGDLAVIGEDGELYFSGRKDFQIKHMGHRIELEEIERALNSIEGVESSCALMITKKNRLAAYYVGEASSEDLRNALKLKVPAYMIPHKLTKVERMPLTKNGKIDRRYFKELAEG